MDDSLQVRKNQAVQLVEQNRLQEARDLYQKICADYEEDGEAWFRLGAVSGMLDDVVKMIDYSRKAVALAPLLPSAYANLAYGLLREGKPMEAAQCYSKMAEKMYEALQYDHARQALSWLLEVPVTLPDEQLADVYMNRGACFTSLGNDADAVKDLQKAVELLPDNPKLYCLLGDALATLSRFEEACEIYHQAWRLQPDSATACARVADAYHHLQRLDDAAHFAEQALAVDANHIPATITLARLDRRAGNLEDACDRLEAARVELPGPMLGILSYELGIVYDRLGRHTEAFESFSRGNEITSQFGRAVTFQNDGSQYLDQLTGFRKSFSAERIAQWRAGKPNDNLPSPVFLVGHPRSGTTLTEQVLAAHHATLVSNERPLLAPVIHRIKEKVATTETIADYLDRISQQDLTSLRADYWDQAESILGAGVRNKILIDKLPANLRNLGIIKRIFPDSSIIVALRDPRDVCLSCFMQHFMPNQVTVHFFDLNQAAHHYEAMMDLWLHYRSVLDLRWMESRYEDLVSDFEPAARRLIDFLDLDWDDAVLTYYKNRHHATTPSYQDVVSPIFSRAMGRWRNYRRELEPVLGRLNRFVHEFGYEK